MMIMCASLEGRLRPVAHFNEAVSNIAEAVAPISMRAMTCSGT
jgi:hypothetical protein